MARERDRWILWLPLPPALGILLYFALPVEPPSSLGLIAGAASVALLIATGRRGRVAALAFLLLMSGFLLAQWRTARVAAPILSREFAAVHIDAVIDRIEPQAGGSSRLLLSRPHIAGLAAERTPKRLRIQVRRGADGLAPGDRVRLRAHLAPPPQPVAPGAFNFARQAYFQGIGGVGFALAAVERLGSSTHPGFRRQVHRLRLHVDRRIRDVVGGRAGAMASALLTGLRGGIPDADEEAMQTAGLAHLLAISGLHMGLVTAAAFFLVRAFLAAIPALALRVDTRKVAAILAWGVALGYLLLAGATYPTQRAFLMTSVVLFALLLDRQAISLRLVAFAALIVLVRAPEAVLSASFQMSFAAVVALVAAYERLGPHWSELGREAGAGRRLALYLLGVLFTTAVAELAIAPFAAFHFSRLTTYGLLANLVAVPVMAFWVMPLGLLALALMPFGLEALALVPMGWGTEIVLGTAEQVAALPGSSLHLAAFPPLALLLASLGGLWALIWRAPALRALSLIPLALATALVAHDRAPDMLIGRDGDLVGVLAPDGLFVSTLGRARFERESWARHYGRIHVARWDRTRENAAPPAACDATGCVLVLARQALPSLLVAVAESPDALLDDCFRADLLITRTVIDVWCPRPKWLIDRRAVLEGGAHALWLEKGRVRIRTVAQATGRRPWAPRFHGRPAASERRDAAGDAARSQ